MRRANAKQVRILRSDGWQLCHDKPLVSARSSTVQPTITASALARSSTHERALLGARGDVCLAVPDAPGQLRTLRPIRFAWLRGLLTSLWSFRPGFDLDSLRRSPQRVQRIERIAVRFRRFGTMAWAVSSLLVLNSFSFLPLVPTHFGAALGRVSGNYLREIQGKIRETWSADLAHPGSCFGHRRLMPSLLPTHFEARFGRAYGTFPRDVANFLREMNLARLSRDYVIERNWPSQCGLHLRRTNPN